MEKKPDALSREERLAAKLRENLKRRKVQARALDQAPGQTPDPAPGQDDNAPLPKGPARS